MKVKNTRLRFKDIKAGVTAYTSSNEFGVEYPLIFTSRPYKVFWNTSMRLGKAFGWFANVRIFYTGSDGETYSFNATESLQDLGITKGSSYNGRRTFRKLKHAEEWASRGNVALGVYNKNE